MTDVIKKYCEYCKKEIYSFGDIKKCPQCNNLLKNPFDIFEFFNNLKEKEND